jgi:hypothetical protein
VHQEVADRRVVRRVDSFQRAVLVAPSNEEALDRVLRAALGQHGLGAEHVAAGGNLQGQHRGRTGRRRDLGRRVLPDGLGRAGAAQAGLVDLIAGQRVRRDAVCLDRLLLDLLVANCLVLQITGADESRSDRIAAAERDDQGDNGDHQRRCSPQLLMH